MSFFDERETEIELVSKYLHWSFEARQKSFPHEITVEAKGRLTKTLFALKRASPNKNSGGKCQPCGDSYSFDNCPPPDSAKELVHLNEIGGCAQLWCDIWGDSQLSLLLAALSRTP